MFEAFFEKYFLGQMSTSETKELSKHFTEFLLRSQSFLQTIISFYVCTLCFTKLKNAKQTNKIPPAKTGQLSEDNNEQNLIGDWLRNQPFESWKSIKFLACNWCCYRNLQLIKCKMVFSTLLKYFLFRRVNVGIVFLFPDYSLVATNNSSSFKAGLFLAKIV